MNTTALHMDHITKVYPNGVLANHDIVFSVDQGEIHALSGENGAGKTTLMKILFGEEKASSGKIFINGKEEMISCPQDALHLGIGMVHQHFMLVPSLTVVENAILGMEPRKHLALDISEATRQVSEIATKYHMALNPRSKVKDLSVGQKQKLEILKVLIRGARILILDEPTAVLTPQETKELFTELKHLRSEGFTIIFISHKLAEVRELCDRITIIRKGTSKGVYDLASITNEEISQKMVGRDVELLPVHQPHPRGEAILSVEHLTVRENAKKTLVNDITFTLHTGEVLGIAGVEGNGQTQLVDAITGMGDFQQGTILFKDKPIKAGHVREARDLGIGHIPEDRMTIGIAPNLSITENLIADKTHWHQFFNHSGMSVPSKIKAYSTEMIENYAILCKNPEVSIASLSGGNIQKVVLARELSSHPQCIVANQPTRGVDVGATEFIRKQLIASRDQGGAVLLISSDLNELFALSDRLLVLYNGTLAACFTDLSHLDEQTLGRYMLGLQHQDIEEIQRNAL
ncbi:ABC transporter ATP-binding protein [uncultured Sphaerochaeta sp.]|uniref:ABC transporter ATP-binding protein n=1 Tax=uncultured Sphaerochaeta sp. TaxID=886478 RepID=UPI002A0A1C73|nr:ABC transporter ATP-binding protein [uncultured Sphaerochaeta sp.]